MTLKQSTTLKKFTLSASILLTLALIFASLLTHTVSSYTLSAATFQGASDFSNQVCIRTGSSGGGGDCDPSNECCHQACIKAQPIRTNVDPQDPLPPSMLTANLSGCCGVNLSWTDNAQGQLGFAIERSTNNADFTQIAAVPPNVTSYIDSNTSQTTNYCYQVRLNTTIIQSVSLETLDGNALDANPVLGNEITFNGQTYGGGVRFFPDATSPLGQPQQLNVRVTTMPPTPNVTIYFRSFDVDDSSGLFTNTAHNGQDNKGPTVRNDGIPLEGSFDGVPAGTTPSAMTDNSGVAKIKFNTTMQPGDNFKIVASTRPSVISTNLMVSGQKILNSTNNMLLMENNVAVAVDTLASDLLTVWRKVHVEYDAMPAPPLPSSTSTGDINYVKGNISQINIKQDINPLRFTQEFLTDQSLRDSSYDMGSSPVGNGRFENGSLIIGSSTIPLIGNFSTRPVAAATTEAQLTPISCQVIDKKGNVINTGILEMIPPGSFRVSTNLTPPGQFNGGSIVVAGSTFIIDKVKDDMVDLDSKVRQPSFMLPFVLFDDDQTVASVLKYPDDFALMTNSDLPTENLFAKTYIKPVFDLTNVKTPHFRRNISNGSDLDAQITDGQDYFPTNNFWVLYVQAGWQPATANDMDPNDEVLTRGATLGQTPNQSLVNGSVIAVETIRDLVVNYKSKYSYLTMTLITKTTTVHECGHQFNLPDRDPSAGGIMASFPISDPRTGQLSTYAFFNDDDQKIIRTRIKPVR